MCVLFKNILFKVYRKVIRVIILYSQYVRVTATERKRPSVVFLLLVVVVLLLAVASAVFHFPTRQDFDHHP